MKTLIAAAALSLALAPAAFAEAVALKAPLQAGSLHTGSLDMIAYRKDLSDGAYEVTAAFRPRSGGAEPQLIKLRLEDQDAVHFSMPGEPRTIYTFARTADAVQISADRLPSSVASQ